MKPSPIDRIKKLIGKRQLVIPQDKATKISKKQEQVQILQLRDIAESSLIGNYCGAIVVAKNNKKKQLLLHIISIYDPKTNMQTNISNNKYLGYLRDYELKVDLSIFTYINAFKNIEIGAFINAMIRKLDKHQHETNINEIHFKNIFELSLSCVKPQNFKIGILKDHTRIPQSIFKVFEKQKTLPMNFQILYTENYDNPGIINQLLAKHNLKQNAIYQPYRKLISESKGQYLQLSRIRYVQQKNWAAQHFQIGLDCLKNRKNQTALDCFKIAKRFDPLNPEIYIARGCTLANMNNISEGIKDLKQALKIDPQNPKARQYYEKITNKASSQDPNTKRKQFNNSKNNYGYVHKK